MGERAGLRMRLMRMASRSSFFRPGRTSRCTSDTYVYARHVSCKRSANLHQQDGVTLKFSPMLAAQMRPSLSTSSSFSSWWSPNPYMCHTSCEYTARNAKLVQMQREVTRLQQSQLWTATVRSRMQATVNINVRAIDSAAKQHDKRKPQPCGTETTQLAKGHHTSSKL